mmetsp:Transcript_4181/g.11358  ORF Transcript_4181/g.11358 Transcript_4181/m.11358 type:complete len:494 (+) Transcript_4181:334-1815(+)
MLPPRVSADVYAPGHARHVRVHASQRRRRHRGRRRRHLLDGHAASHRHARTLQTLQPLTLDDRLILAPLIDTTGACTSTRFTAREEHDDERERQQGPPRVAGAAPYEPDDGELQPSIVQPLARVPCHRAPRRVPRCGAQRTHHRRDDERGAPEQRDGVPPTEPPNPRDDGREPEEETSAQRGGRTVPSHDSLRVDPRLRGDRGPGRGARGDPPAELGGHQPDVGLAPASGAFRLGLGGGGVHAPEAEAKAQVPTHALKEPGEQRRREREDERVARDGSRGQGHLPQAADAEHEVEAAAGDSSGAARPAPVREVVEGRGDAAAGFTRRHRARGCPPVAAVAAEGGVPAVVRPRGRRRPADLILDASRGCGRGEPYERRRRRGLRRGLSRGERAGRGTGLWGLVHRVRDGFLQRDDAGLREPHAVVRGALARPGEFLLAFPLGALVREVVGESLELLPQPVGLELRLPQALSLPRGHGVGPVGEPAANAVEGRGR